MKITKDNLKKFFTTFSSKKEVNAINNWLLSNKEENTNVTLKELSVIKSEMWNSISDSIPVAKKSRIIPLYKKAIRYAAVASVVLILGFFGADNMSFLDTNLALANNTSKIRTNTTVNGLELGLTNKSTANINSSFSKVAKEITFCGNMTIKNTTKSNIKIKVHSTCKTNEIKEKLLLKNRTYYAYTIKEKLYIINKGRYLKMPYHLRPKIKYKKTV